MDVLSSLVRDVTGGTGIVESPDDWDDLVAQAVQRGAAEPEDIDLMSEAFVSRRGVPDTLSPTVAGASHATVSLAVGSRRGWLWAEAGKGHA